MMSFVYLASPYSSPSPEIRASRFLAVERATASLLKDRVWVYSPIVHCHAMSMRYGMPTDAAYWQEYNFAMLDRAMELLVLTLPGWQDSLGIAMELERARKYRMTVSFMQESVDD